MPATAGSSPTPTGNYKNANGYRQGQHRPGQRASITVTPYSVTYDGNSHTATGTATGVGGVDLGSDLNLTGTTHTNAGTYASDAWTFTRRHRQLQQRQRHGRRQHRQGRCQRSGQRLHRRL